jgi:protocatechuate 3,4-dioxygenase beta subunit
MTHTRRQVLAAGASVIGVVGMPAISFGAGKTMLPATASIGNIPEYVRGAPIRKSFLRPGLAGQRIRLVGKALTTERQPLAKARLDFWQTDSSGTYDMGGYDFRGRQFIDNEGGFLLETVMPGQYNGARHIHYLLATRPRGRTQPLWLSGVVFFPTAEEFAQASTSDRVPEFLDPSSLPLIDGVSIARCDIVLEVA